MASGKITFIGLGLNDEKDISLKGVKEIKKSDLVFAEFYTSQLTGTSLEKLEKKFETKINVLNREETENGEKILKPAEEEKKIVFLTCGDTMTATTHIDLRIQAKKRNISTSIIHGSSIVTAAPGLLGLQNYKFGRSTTLVYPKKNYFPMSPYQVIKENLNLGLHTLVLLDIEAEKNQYMTANEGMKILLDMEKKQKDNLITENNVICVIGKAGSSKPTIKAGIIKELLNIDFGEKLHTIIIPGKVHFKEIEALQSFADLPAEYVENLQKI